MARAVCVEQAPDRLPNAATRQPSGPGVGRCLARDLPDHARWRSIGRGRSARRLDRGRGSGRRAERLGWAVRARVEQLHVQSETERALAGMSALLRLASELVWATTATEVLRFTVKRLSRPPQRARRGPAPGPGRLGMVHCSIGGRGCAATRRAARIAPTTSGSPGSRRLRLPSIAPRFRQVTGCRAVEALQAGPAVLLLGDVPEGHEDFADGVASLVRAVLPRLGLGAAPDDPAIVRVSSASPGQLTS